MSYTVCHTVCIKQIGGRSVSTNLANDEHSLAFDRASGSIQTPLLGLDSDSIQVPKFSSLNFETERKTKTRVGQEVN